MIQPVAKRAAGDFPVNLIPGSRDDSDLALARDVGKEIRHHFLQFRNDLISAGDQNGGDCPAHALISFVGKDTEAIQREMVAVNTEHRLLIIQKKRDIPLTKTALAGDQHRFAGVFVCFDLFANMGKVCGAVQIRNRGGWRPVDVGYGAAISEIDETQTAEAPYKPIGYRA